MQRECLCVVYDLLAYIYIPIRVREVRMSERERDKSKVISIYLSICLSIYLAEEVKRTRPHSSHLVYTAMQLQQVSQVVNIYPHTTTRIYYEYIHRAFKSKNLASFSASPAQPSLPDQPDQPQSADLNTHLRICVQVK